jgi:predicted DNA-binding protein
MGRKISARLPDPLHARLLATAKARNVTSSDIIREALERVESLAVDKRDHLQNAHEPIAESHDPDACAQRLLAMLPPEVRAVILEKADLLSFSRLLHERPLYLMGKSLFSDHPETYRHALMLYTTRNKLGHRGELSEEDATKSFSLNEKDARVALRCVADIFRWFGEAPIKYPTQRMAQVLMVNQGRLNSAREQR